MTDVDVDDEEANVGRRHVGEVPPVVPHPSQRRHPSKSPNSYPYTLSHHPLGRDTKALLCLATKPVNKPLQLLHVTFISAFC